MNFPLYRAIDWDGNPVDSMLSEKRDMDAAKHFFKQTADVVVHAPKQVRTDYYDPYPRAIRESFGSEVTHTSNLYLNDRLEPDLPFFAAIPFTRGTKLKPQDCASSISRVN